MTHLVGGAIAAMHAGKRGRRVVHVAGGVVIDVPHMEDGAGRQSHGVWSAYTDWRSMSQLLMEISGWLMALGTVAQPCISRQR